MSTVFVHVGQCGNQLAIPLWKNFLSHAEKNNSLVFASIDKRPRSIHIDTEPKVVNSLPPNFNIRGGNIIVGKRGRGSNFALGFNGFLNNEKNHLLNDALDSFRQEVERCDCFTGTILFHSLGGGTGSGLGSRFLEIIRDEFPCYNIFSCSIAPCKTGESPLQSYNSLLTLKHLINYSDAVLVLENDWFFQRLSKAGQGESISLDSVNKEISNHLAGLFSPTDTLLTKSRFSLGQEPWELIRTLTPMPDKKFISVIQHASKQLSWDGLTSNVLSSHRKRLSSGNAVYTIGSTVIARGDCSTVFLSDLKRGLDSNIKKGLRTVSWNPFPIDVWTASKNISAHSRHNSLTLAVNSSNILDYLDTVITQSTTKLKSRAYLHWYERYGIGTELFEESLNEVYKVVGDYRKATSE